MNVTLNKFSRFAIVALMLFMQSATIAHSIEHADGEHTEHCSAFTTAEQLADTPKDNGFLAAPSASYFTPQSSPSLFFITKRLGKLSRAPPASI